MLVDAKPPLDEDLLLHYGIPGMKWGQRHDYIPIGRGGGGGGGGGGGLFHPNRAAAPAPSQARRSAAPPQRTGMSRGKKIALGVGIVGGAAAAAYFLSKTGTRPHAQAMTSRSNAAGLKMTMGILKRSGKMGLSGIKGMPKVAKVGGKATYKTSKFVGKTAGKAGKTVAVNSSKTARDFISKLKTPSGPSTVRGEKFGKVLLGEYGPKGFTSGGGGLAYVPSRLPRREQTSFGSE